ncbi:MAG TPA: O-methyltransferase [Thermoanaerobaculia bacterium]|jgi:predicted O-methyltransferase YrrM
MSEQWSRVDEHLDALFAAHDDALDAALRASDEAGLPQIAVAPNQGKFLQILSQSIGAKHVLEIGTLGAYSTIWLARALPAGGRVLSLEVNAHHAEVARANVARAGLADVVEVRLGPALETLPHVEGPFDFTFIDADKHNIPHYFSHALRLSRPGALIVVDNVVRQGAILDAASEDVSVQGVRRFNELVANEPRVNATTLQTVGTKGWDGFAIVLVK